MRNWMLLVVLEVIYVKVKMITVQAILFMDYTSHQKLNNIVLNDGVLLEKKTFKGLNKTSLKSNDFFTLASGEK
jgi:hypothetical protein